MKKEYQFKKALAFLMIGIFLGVLFVYFGASQGSTARDFIRRSVCTRRGRVLKRLINSNLQEEERNSLITFLSGLQSISSSGIFPGFQLFMKFKFNLMGFLGIERTEEVKVFIEDLLYGKHEEVASDFKYLINAISRRS